MESTALVQPDDSFPLIGSHSRTNSFGYRSINLNIGRAKEDEDDDDQSVGDSDDLHKTTATQTFIHLLKGYMGAGCLSLPWAVSQLGLFWGPLAIFTVSYWSSYNCWTIVQVKRFIEQENTEEADKNSVASSVTTNTQVTYAAVGAFFYGTQFETYVAACVCTQQLAICTVFISFVGENILAVMKSLDITFMATHAGVMTLELPFIMSLCLIPNLKSLTPVMTLGTILLVVTFFAIGVIIQQEWPSRPMEPIELDLANAPLAISAILYSYEGINLILPVESAMLEPQYFRVPFFLAMVTVAAILASFSFICVLTFGNVTSGSVTAFLIEAYPDDPNVAWWLMIANTAVSLSVLLTYPLQLFPALELLGPSFSKFIAGTAEDESESDDLSAFEPLPPLPEHSIADIGDWDEHQYNAEDEGDGEDQTKDGESNSVTYSAITSIQTLLPEMTMPGDSPLLRVTLVILTYAVAVAVPNVQSLISLAGALAGSSSALLIPPMLELAWIGHLEVPPDDGDGEGNESRAESRWTTLAPGTDFCGLGKWWFEKLKCYVLLSLGFLFFCIGTFAAIADIVRIYVETT